MPLDVPCRLEFESDNNVRVKTPPLSFTVPAKAEAWRVEFPFVVLLANNNDDDDENGGRRRRRVARLRGLRLTCLERNYFLSFSGDNDRDDNDRNCGRFTPAPPSTYKGGLDNATRSKSVATPAPLRACLFCLE